jgi:1,4-dihydroxy-2-naphthoate octaprenyltransferase
MTRGTRQGRQGYKHYIYIYIYIYICIYIYIYTHRHIYSLCVGMCVPLPVRHARPVPP